MESLKYQAQAIVAAPIEDVIRAVSDIAAIHQWNPALSAIRTNDQVAASGKRYLTRIRGIVPAFVTYHKITDSAVTYELRALGNVERGTWEVGGAGHRGSTVSHSFEHHGLILRLMHDMFMPVAMWRLARLRSLLTSSTKSV